MQKMIGWLGAVILMISILMVGTVVNVTFLSDYKVIKGSEFLSGPKDIPYHLEHEKIEEQMKLADPDYINGEVTYVYEAIEMGEGLIGDDFIFKAYLNRGTELEVTFETNLQDEGYVEFLFLNKKGIINHLEGDSGTLKMKIKQSGNYGIVLNRQSKEGTVDVEITVKN